jgi:NAD(P)H-flavin reductase
VTAQNPNFTFIPTIIGHRTPAWPYEKGHINREMLTRYLCRLKGPVYIAGSSAMVTVMTDLLRSSGVSDDDMKAEEIGDYKG